MKRENRMVSLVYLVCLVEPDRPDEPDQHVSPVSLGSPMEKACYTCPHMEQKLVDPTVPFAIPAA